MAEFARLRLLLVIAMAACVWSVVLFATGGFVWQTPWLRLASRDPFRPLLLGVCCALVYWYSAPATGVLDRLQDVVTRRRLDVATTIATYLHSTQGATVSSSVKAPAFYTGGGVRIYEDDHARKGSLVARRS